MVLKDTEQAHLTLFREFLSEKSLTIPEGYIQLFLIEYRYDDNSRLLLRYLQGLKFNYALTQTTLTDHSKWCIETFPMNPESFKKYLDLGVIYCLKRDKGHRPILIMNVERMISS
jgi:hypothetical protein